MTRQQAITRGQVEAAIYSAKMDVRRALDKAADARCDADLDRILDTVQRRYRDQQSWEKVLAALPA